MIMIIDSTYEAANKIRIRDESAPSLRNTLALNNIFARKSTKDFNQ